MPTPPLPKRVGSAPASPQVKVTSQLLQNHRLATTVTGETMISASWQPGTGTKTLQVFSIGSNRRVYCTYQDPDSDTGWSIVDLNYPGSGGADFIGSVNNMDGSVSVIAADTQRNLYLLTLTTAMPGASLPAWVPLPSLNVGSIRTGPPAVGGGFPPFIAVLNLDDQKFYQLDCTGEPTWSRPYPLNPSGFAATSDWLCSFICEDPTLSSLPGVVWTVPKPASLRSGAWSGSMPAGYNFPGPWGQICQMQDGNGDWQLFAISTKDRSIYSLQPPGRIGNQYVATRISNNAGYQSLVAGCPFDACFIELFALDEQGFLWHSRETGDATQYEDFVCLNQDLRFVGNSQKTLFTALVNPEDGTEVFAVTTDGILYHIWQDRESTDWNFDRIEVNVDGQLEDVPTYQTVIQVFDAAGSAMPYTPVTLSTPNQDSVSLEINGETTQLSASEHWSGLTDGLGNLVINQATSGLATPALQLWVTGMPPNDYVEIDASGVVQSTLANATGQDLLDYVAQTGTSLTDANAIAGALKEVLALPTQSAALTQFLHPKADRRVARCVSAGQGGRARICPTPGRETHWVFDVRSGRPRFRTLQASEAQSLIAHATTLPQLSSSHASWLGSWGDLFSALKNGVATLLEGVVSTIKEVANTVTAVLTVVIKGVQYVYQAVISLVEQAMDLAEEILGVIGAKFTQLFKWLGYIFNWPNILRTQQAAVHTVNEVLQFFQDAAAIIQQKVDGKLQSVAAQIQSNFDKLKSQLGANATVGSYQASYLQPTENYDSPAAQIMSTHLTQNAPNATFPSSSALRADATLPDALQNVIDQMNSLAQKYSVDTNLTAALNSFKAAFSSPDAYLQLALNGLLSLVEAAVLAILAGVQLLIDAVLSAVAAIISAVQTLLNEEVEIPILSDLYRRMTTSTTNPDGSPLTALSLAALLVAVPCTVVYTLVEGTAPFPDDDSLTSFTTGFTSSLLLTNSGLSSSLSSARKLPASVTGALTEDSDEPDLPKILGGLRAGMLGVATVLEPALDMQPPTGMDLSKLTKFLPKQIKGSSLSLFNYTLVSLGLVDFACSIPWVEGSKSWSPASSEGWQCYGFIKDGIGCCIDLLSCMSFGSLPRFISDLGVWYDFTFALTSLGMSCMELVLTVAEQGDASDILDAAGGVIGGGRECLRIGRLSEIVLSSYGISLAVVACTDAIGNLAEMGLTVASTLTANSNSDQGTPQG